MNTYPDIPSFFAEQGPEHIEHFVSLNLDLSQRIYTLMQERSWSESDLARALSITEAEVSLRLGGTYDWRLRELAELEVVLGGDLIMITE
jgi:hypothetical protein